MNSSAAGAGIRPENPAQPVRLVVFDLDGTILDTLEDLKDALNAALSAHHLPERTLDEVRRFVGNGIGLLIARGVPEGTPADVTAAVHKDFTAYYSVHCADHTRPYDGIPALVRELRSAGILTAVVSNKADYAVQTLVETYFPGLFDAAAGEREGIRRKPAPDTVNAILETLGIDRTEAVYIGDSDVDIETAENAGMPCISVLWGFRDQAFLLEHGAECLAASPEELRKMIMPPAKGGRTEYV